MSKEVKRYAPWDSENGMVEHQFGNWVDADDYEALLAENESMRGLYKMHQQTETREMRELRAERDALLAERDAAQKDAERYRWLRMADWWNSPLCVIRDPKQQAKPGTDCPSRDRLDAAIDAARQGEQP